MGFEPAIRLKKLPPFLFDELSRLKKEMEQGGRKVIDLSVGDPDIPTPAPVVEELRSAAGRGENHRYPPYRGTGAFRKAAAGWMRGRFGVSLDPDREILCLIGSKEGIAHAPLAFVDPGDVVLVPDPGYPVYSSAAIFAGAEPFRMPLREERSFLPDFGAVPSDILSKARLIFLNYPNNPTSASCGLGFFEEAAAFARGIGAFVCHDASYSEMYLGEERPPSFLQAKGGREVGIEFHSLSKTFSMTGWRVGFAAGNAGMIEALGKLKTNIDSGVFGAVQDAAVEALRLGDGLAGGLRQVYRARRSMVASALRSAGIRVFESDFTFYVWASAPEGFTSASFAKKLLVENGIAVTPGTGFGPAGEGWFRISLTAPEPLLAEASARMSGIAS